MTQKTQRGKPKAITIKDIENRIKNKAGGCYMLRSAYLSDRLHLKSNLAQGLRDEENEWARFLGVGSFDELPIAARKMVKLFIGDWIFISYYTPGDDDTTSIREIRASMNSCARLALQLSAMKAERTIPQLNDWIESKYGHKADDDNNP